MFYLVKFLLFLYRKIAPYPFRCRFYPSCSYYAEESVEKYGFFYGSFLALKRLIRCNPWHPGGHDPVP